MLLSFLLLLGTVVTGQLQEELPNPLVPTKQTTNEADTTETFILGKLNKRVEKVFEVTKNLELEKNWTSPWEEPKFQWEVEVNSNSTDTVRVIIQHGNDTKSLRLPYRRTLNRKKTETEAPLPGRNA